MRPAPEKPGHRGRGERREKMADLTDKERELIKRGFDTALVRPVEQWMQILRDLPTHDAAARVFGDLHCYRSDEKIRGQFGHRRREGFLQDVQNLANVLKAMIELAHAQHDSDEAA